MYAMAFNPRSYLTPEKLYELLTEDDLTFTIFDDDGDKLTCFKPPHSCCHLREEHWYFISTDDGT